MHPSSFFDRFDLLLQIIPLILSAGVTAEETNFLGLVVHSMRSDVVSAIGDLPHHSHGEPRYGRAGRKSP